MDAKILVKNELKWISKFCSEKNCPQMLALIWNDSELFSSCSDVVMKILLEAIHGL